MKTRIMTLCLIMLSFFCRAQYFSSSSVLHNNQYISGGSYIVTYNTDYDGNNLMLHYEHTCMVCNDATVSKYGKPQNWSRTIGNNMTFSGNTHILYGDSSGNTYYFGKFSASLQVNGVNTQIICWQADSFVFLKFDTIGVAKWRLNKVMRNAFVDYYGNSYIADDTLLTLYNTQGQIQWQRPTAGPYVFADTAYNYYQWDSTNLVKYDATGNVLWQYPAPSKNFYFDKMGKKLYFSSTLVTEVDVQTGTIINSWSNTLPFAQKFDSNGNCYAWQGQRFKKSGPSGDWSFMIDTTITFFDIDKYDNVKHIYSTTDPYRYSELHQFIPPSLMIDYYPGIYGKYPHLLVGFTISPDDTLQNATITTGNIPAICTEGRFDVPFTLNNYFVQYKDSGFVVQLSDSAGSFAYPLVIGQGYYSPIACSLPYFNLYGTNYRVRVVSKTNPVITGTPNPLPLSVSNASPAYIGTSNNLTGSGPCSPVNLVVQPPGHYYCNWFLDDYNSPSILLPYGGHASVEPATGNHDGEHYAVIASDSVTGCRYELRTGAFYLGGAAAGTMPLNLPDTVCKNAGPITIKKPTQSGQFLSTAINGNLLFPDSMPYGLNNITYVTFDTVSCYAPSVTKQVFVDSCLYTIKTKTIGNGSKNKFCSGDSIEVNFEYDSTAFPAGTVFYVQFTYYNGIFQTGMNITGSGTTSPIHATIPVLTMGTAGYRYRVISQAPPVNGSLNMEGDIAIYTLPVVNSFTVTGSVTNCGTGINLLNIYAGGNYFNWHTDSMDFADTTKYPENYYFNPNYYYSSNFLATTNGHYWVTVTNEAGCSVTSDTIIILDSAGVVQATLSTLSPGVCPGDSIQMRLVTDSLNTVTWSLSNTLFTPANDTLFYVNNAGNYTATVTNAVGCKRSFNITVPLYPATIFSLNGIPKKHLCPGDSIRITPNTMQLNSYQWFENGIAQPQFNGQLYIYVHDSATYAVSGVNSYGCRSLSAALPVPVIQPVVAQFTKDTLYYCAQPGQVNLQALSTGGVSPYSWTISSAAGIHLYSTASDSLSVTLTAPTQGTYTVTVSDSLCAALNTDTLIALSYTMPAVSLFSTDSTTFCIGDSALLLTTLPQADNYLWLLNGTDTLANGLSDSIYAYTQGNYSVVITDSVCFNTTNLLPVTTPCTVGLSDIDNGGNSIYIWPNPIDEKLFVIQRQIEKNLRIKITDVAGHIIYKGNLAYLKTKTEINTMHFANGMYMAEITGNESRVLLKFVVSH